MPSQCLFLMIIFSFFAGRSIANADKAQALFVFGASSADTGNKDPYNQTINQPWRRPYGLTWPGYPAGRFSSGKIQTDFWGDILGVPSPIAYELLKSHDCKASEKKMRHGVNFAVGGSAIFRAYGFITVAQQVTQFKELIGGSQGFDSHKLSRSVVLFSAAGNDYEFIASRNGSIEEMIDLVRPVVSGITDAVKELYESGLGNFVVSSVDRLGYEPKIGKTSCDSKYDDLLALHTRLLRESVESLRSDLKELSIIIADLASAYNHIFSNPAEFGLVDLFVPCCAEKGGVEKCGEVDEIGRPLFEVCSDAEEKFRWDSGHPTQRGWHAILSLYRNGAKVQNKTISFVEGAPNVISWLHSLGFVAHSVPTLFSRH